ncbi:hypothetical protein GCM10009804_41740 [Kribbella hippodromi]|uniref:DUF3137 domain-containing protein n=1 Tax=Kribbella hippodromi TaxID=434347 RepID=A0ABN2DQN9_9ACTN
MIATFALLIPLLLLAFVFGVVALVLRNGRRQRAWQQARAAQLASLGCYLVPPDPWLEQVAGSVFRAGGEVTEAWAGSYHGRNMYLFDYRYVTSNGKTQSTHLRNLVALYLPVALPPLMVTQETGRIFKGRDLELENAEFNDRFRVDCDDDRYGSAVMHPRMMECVLYNPGLQWLISGNAFVTWGEGNFDVPDVHARLEAMTRLIDLIPPFVLRDYGQPTYR